MSLEETDTVLKHFADYCPKVINYFRVYCYKSIKLFSTEPNEIFKNIVYDKILLVKRHIKNLT